MTDTKLDVEKCLRLLQRSSDWPLTSAEKQLHAALILLAEAREALKAVSPWKLQDCWCSEPDRGGPNNPHNDCCTLARVVMKRIPDLSEVTK